MLIKQEELSELKPAAELHQVSSSAELDQERAAVARLCNLAANTHEFRAVWQHPISETLLQELQSLGYRVSPMVPYNTLNDNVQYLIEWV